MRERWRHHSPTSTLDMLLNRYEQLCSLSTCHRTLYSLTETYIENNETYILGLWFFKTLCCLGHLAGLLYQLLFETIDSALLSLLESVDLYSVALPVLFSERRKCTTLFFCLLRMGSGREQCLGQREADWTQPSLSAVSWAIAETLAVYCNFFLSCMHRRLSEILLQ